MRRTRRAVLLLAAVMAAGCATNPGHVGPEGIARLERARNDNPNSAATNRALGIAYYTENRYPEARKSLTEAARLDPKDGTTQLYLGLTAEAQNDLPAARAAYSSYVNYGRTARVRRLLEDRLAALTRKELAADARKAVADEKELASVPGSPRTVAVLPLRFSGSDTTLRPLERGMAELLTTDLARSSQLTVVERTRVQALVDELQLQQSGATDASTNVRAGRLLRAGRLVSGQILQTGNDLRVDAAVVDVPTTQVAGTASDDRTLDQLFTIEQNIAFGVFNSLGVTLTTAERNAIEQRPTKSLAAFLAYSRGLTLADEGRYDDANRYFDQAVRLDPGFLQAQQQRQQTQATAQGQQMTPSTVEGALKGTTEGQIVAAATQGSAVPNVVSGGSTAGATAQGLNPSTSGIASLGGGTTTTTATSGKSNPGSTTTGTDNPATNTATVILVIKVPH